MYYVIKSPADDVMKTAHQDVSSDLPPPYLEAVGEMYIQGIISQPPASAPVLINGYSNRNACACVSNCSDGPQQQGCPVSSGDNSYCVSPRYGASNSQRLYPNLLPLKPHSNNNAVMTSQCSQPYSNVSRCSPVTPSAPLLRNETYISISNRILAATADEAPTSASRHVSLSPHRDKRCDKCVLSYLCLAFTVITIYICVMLVVMWSLYSILHVYIMHVLHLRW